jgi:DNA/RNA endonuclease YhcR with UshA esterase domain
VRGPHPVGRHRIEVSKAHRSIDSVSLWAISTGAATVAPGDAESHVGETATVCGMVASAKYAASSRSQPTFLDLDRPYPNASFTAVIFGSDRAKFGTPETTLPGKRVCVTGQIRDYRGRPEIILSEPGQLNQ